MKLDIVDYVTERVREAYANIEIYGASLDDIVLATIALYASRLAHEASEARPKEDNKNAT